MGMIPYKWNTTGFIMYDGQAWCAGFNFGTCVKEAMDERTIIETAIMEADGRRTIEAECEIYRVNARESFEWKTENTEKWVYIALCNQYRWPILFWDENSMNDYLDLVRAEDDAK